MASSATSRALGIDELLESILVNLSIVQLLPLKQVCSRWNGVISNSPAIQKILFLRPDAHSTVERINPLFHSHLPTSYTTEGETGPLSHFVVSSDLLHLLKSRVPGAWRSMLMFQPPQRYNLTLRASASNSFAVDLPIGADEPIMVAVERAAAIIQLEEQRLGSPKALLETPSEGGLLACIRNRRNLLQHPTVLG
jgi:hypothetical protein